MNKKENIILSLVIVVIMIFISMFVIGTSVSYISFKNQETNINLLKDKLNESSKVINQQTKKIEDLELQMGKVSKAVSEAPK